MSSVLAKHLQPRLIVSPLPDIGEHSLYLSCLVLMLCLYDESVLVSDPERRKGSAQGDSCRCEHGRAPHRALVAVPLLGWITSISRTRL